MVKRISKNGLGFIQKLFIVSLNSKKARDITAKYNSEIEKSLSHFSSKLVKMNFKSDSPEFNYLRDLFLKATIFRTNKSLWKTLITSFTVTLMIVGIFIAPIFLQVNSENSFTFWLNAFIYLLSIVLTIIVLLLLGVFLKFLSNFEAKLGRTQVRITRLVIVALVLFPFNFFSGLENEFFNLILVNIWVCLLLFTLSLIVIYILSEFLIDVIYFSKKVQLTESLLIESIYSLSKVNWNRALNRREHRQEALIEIERLAKLIENDWGSHIIPGDNKTNHWKKDTFIGIASSIRKIKRKVIIPSQKSQNELNVIFDEIFAKILINDWLGLVDEEVPAARVRKKSFVVGLRSFLVAILPFSLIMSIKAYAPNSIPADYIHFSLIISALWLVVSFLLWLDPNLADKISTIKSFRSVFKEDSESN